MKDQSEQAPASGKLRPPAGPASEPDAQDLMGNAAAQDDLAAGGCESKGTGDRRGQAIGGNFVPRISVSPGCTERELNEPFDIEMTVLNAAQAPNGMVKAGEFDDGEPYFVLADTEFTWGGQFGAQFSSSGAPPKGPDATVNVAPQRTGELEAGASVKTVGRGITDEGVELYYDVLHSDASPVNVTVPAPSFTPSISVDGVTLAEPNVMRRSLFNITFRPTNVDESRLSGIDRQLLVTGGVTQTGEGQSPKGHFSPIFAADTPGPFSVQMVWTWSGTTVTTDVLEGAVQVPFDNGMDVLHGVLRPGGVLTPDFASNQDVLRLQVLREVLKDVAPGTWPAERLLQRADGARALEALKVAAQQFTAGSANMGNNLWSQSPLGHQVNTQVAATLGMLGVTAFLDANALIGDDAAELLVGLDTREMDRLAEVMTQFGELASALGKGVRQTADFCAAISLLFFQIASANASNTDLQFGGEYLDKLAEIQSWVDELAELADETDSPPWFMYVPILNFPGLLFYDPFTNAVSEHSAEIFAPILIPVLAGFHAAIAPHEIPQILFGKIDIIQQIANPNLSQDAKWALLLEYGGKEVVSIVVGKMGKGLPKHSEPPVSNDLATWSAWLGENRKAIGYKVLLDVLKGGTKDSVSVLAGTKEPEDVLRNAPKTVLKSVISQMAGLNNSESPGAKLTEKAVQKVSIDELMKLLPSVL